MKLSLKRLILVTLIVGAAAALSGCGKILEAFFPNETGKGGGQNFVKVLVKLASTIDGATFHNVVVRLKPVGQEGRSMVRSGVAFLPEGETDATVQVQFEFLPDGDFTLDAWLDKNNDWKPDPNEPTGSGPGVFHLPDVSGRNISLEMRVYPAAGSGQAKVTVTARINNNIAGGNYVGPNQWVMELFRQDAPLFEPFKRMQAQGDGDSDGYGQVQFIFDSLPAGTYKATVWFDPNMNFVWDDGEPGSVAKPGSEEFFSLGASQQILINATVEPAAAAGVPRVFLKAPQIVDESDGTGKTLDLRFLQPPGTWTLSSWTYSIWDYQNSYYVTSVDVTGGSSTDTYVLGSLPLGYYTIDVTDVVLYNGSDYEYTSGASADVRVITEELNGQNYRPYFNAYSLDLDPFKLSTFSNYDVRIQFRVSDGDAPGWAGGDKYTLPGALTGGAMDWTTSYSIGFYSDGTIDYSAGDLSRDYALILVDTNWNGNFGDPSDLIARLELGVDYNADWYADEGKSIVYMYGPWYMFLRRGEYYAVYDEAPPTP